MTDLNLYGLENRLDTRLTADQVPVVGKEDDFLVDVPDFPSEGNVSGLAVSFRRGSGLVTNSI